MKDSRMLSYYIRRSKHVYLIQKDQSYERHVTLNLPIVKWFITPDCNILNIFQETACSIRRGETRLCQLWLLFFCQWINTSFPGVVGLPRLVAELSIVDTSQAGILRLGPCFLQDLDALGEREGRGEVGSIWGVRNTILSYKHEARHVIDVVYSPWCSGSTSDCNSICVQKTLVVCPSDWSWVRNSSLILLSDPRRGENAALLWYLFAGCRELTGCGCCGGAKCDVRL
jgi:hypothetical protein